MICPISKQILPKLHPSPAAVTLACGVTGSGDSMGVQLDVGTLTVHQDAVERRDLREERVIYIYIYVG